VNRESDWGLAVPGHAPQRNPLDPNILPTITLISTATNKPTTKKPQIAPKNIPKDAGLTIAWKDGMVSSSFDKK
jgi:hypothetical protein